MGTHTSGKVCVLSKGKGKNLLQRHQHHGSSLVQLYQLHFYKANGLLTTNARKFCSEGWCKRVGKQLAFNVFWRGIFSRETITMKWIIPQMSLRTRDKSSSSTKSRFATNNFLIWKVEMRKSEFVCASALPGKIRTPPIRAQNDIRYEPLENGIDFIFISVSLSGPSSSSFPFVKMSVYISFQESTKEARHTSYLLASL